MNERHEEVKSALPTNLDTLPQKDGLALTLNVKYRDFRYVVPFIVQFPQQNLLLSLLTIALLFVSGIWYFRETGRAFAGVN